MGITFICYNNSRTVAERVKAMSAENKKAAQEVFFPTPRLAKHNDPPLAPRGETGYNGDKELRPVLQAYEGYLDKGRFYPIGPPVSLQGRRRVIITVLDEPTQKETPQAAAWREFFEAVNASDEEIPETFERVNFTREADL